MRWVYLSWLSDPNLFLKNLWMDGEAWNVQYMMTEEIRYLRSDAECRENI